MTRMICLPTQMKARQIYYEGILNGPFISYYENGRIREKGLYTDDRPVGYFMSWYEAGIPYQTLQYPEKKASDGTSSPSLINYWDSLGRPLVNNSNGFCVCYKVAENNAILKEKGKIVNGKRDSVWIGTIDGTFAFKEKYNNGEFVEGIRYDRHPEYRYTKLGEQPEFLGGMEEMMRFISKTLRYPADARRAGTMGRVYVAYVIERDGTIGDVIIDRGVSESLDNEALRIIRQMPKWKPGTYRGNAVRVKFVIPVSFKLG